MKPSELAQRIEKHLPIVFEVEDKAVSALLFENLDTILAALRHHEALVAELRKHMSCAEAGYECLLCRDGRQLLATIEKETQA